MFQSCKADNRFNFGEFTEHKLTDRSEERIEIIRTLMLKCFSLIGEMFLREFW